MTKLKWSTTGFARRVMMGGPSQIFVLVEGRANDRVFYDRVVRSIEHMKNWEHYVNLVEQIEFEEEATPAGGKNAAYRLFEYYQQKNLLVQSNNNSSGGIVFALDRDYDSLVGTGLESPHIIYTRLADVEAEILINGDIKRALESAFSLDSKAIEIIVKDLVNPADHLALLWREWLTLLVAVLRHKLEVGFNYAKGPAVNASGKRFCKVEEVVLKDLKDAIIRELSEKYSEDAEDIMSNVEADVDTMFALGEQSSLIKGKWLAAFIHDWVRDRAHSLTVIVPHQDTIARCGVETLDYDGSWMDYYNRKFLSLIQEINSHSGLES
jgi:hypothetical protein